MAISFNTGTTGSASTATSCAITIPAGVLTGDVMIVGVEVFTQTSSQPTVSFSGGGGTWTLLTVGTGTNPEVATAGSSVWSYGFVYYRVATAGDPGATLTISESGSAAGSTWFAVALAAYTGANSTQPDVANGSNAQGVFSTTGPSATTATTGDWAVFICLGALNSGNFTYSTGTLREQVTSGALVAAALYDSAASVGNSGTSIGGGTWSQSGNTSNWFSMFVIGLAPPSSSTAHTATVSMSVVPRFVAIPASHIQKAASAPSVVPFATATPAVAKAATSSPSVT